MGNYSYITEWKTAIERTERFGLKLPECRLQSEKRYLTPQFIQEFPFLLLSFVSARGYGKVKNEERKVLRATFFILHFSLFTLHCSFFTFLSLLNQLLCVRLSVFDNAHKVQSCRQSCHRDLERRLICPERADSLVCILIEIGRASCRERV